jgi:phage shock protein E
MNFIKKNLFAIIGVILGAIGGYLYYHFVGCVSGTCAITSKPLNSTLYGALMGGIFLSIFQRNKKPENKTTIHEEK